MSLVGLNLSKVTVRVSRLGDPSVFLHSLSERIETLTLGINDMEVRH